MDKGSSTKKIIIVGLTIIVVIIILGILPELILCFRGLIKKTPFLQGLFAKGLSDKEYISIMVGPLFSCVAIFVSILAFRTAKSTGKIQLIQKNAMIIIATTNMQRIIQKNMDVINRLNNNTGNIKDLLVNEDVIKEAAYLYGAKIITIDQFKYFIKFLKDISKILDLYNQSKDDEKNQEIKKFCEKYFEADTIEYTSKLKKLKHDLEIAENEVN